MIPPSPQALAPSIALSIAGSDCSSGAGIQADLKTFTALGCYGLTVLTSVVAEVPAKVTHIQLLEPVTVAEQLRVLAQSLPIRAFKTGMLGAAPQIQAVLQVLDEGLLRGIPLVIDPVMIATSGRRLLDESAMELLTRSLFPRATLITPNMDEAAALLGHSLSSREEMEAAALTLSQRFQTSVLLKGGHLLGDQAPDFLVHPGGTQWFEGVRIAGVKTHGTGCTYSAAITAGLAQGKPLPEAVQAAKVYVTLAIAAHHRWGDVTALNHQP
jgi:hydroxymethylpyrimidine/phosphomethylpyrimidine kinase